VSLELLLLLVIAIAALFILWPRKKERVASTEITSYAVCTGCGALARSNNTHFRPCDWCLTPYWEGKRNPSYGQGHMARITEKQYVAIKNAADRLRKIKDIGTENLGKEQA
jgi:hypothetical protein